MVRLEFEEGPAFAKSCRAGTKERSSSQFSGFGAVLVVACIFGGAGCGQRPLGQPREEAMVPPKRVLFSPREGQAALTAIEFGADGNFVVLSSSAKGGGIRRINIDGGNIGESTLPPSEADPQSLQFFKGLNQGEYCLGGNGCVYCAGNAFPLRFAKLDIGLKLPRVEIAGTIGSGEMIIYSSGASVHTLYRYGAISRHARPFCDWSQIRHEYPKYFVDHLSCVTVCGDGKFVAYQLDQRIGILNASGKLVSLEDKRNVRSAMGYSADGKYLISANNKLMLHRPDSVEILKSTPIFYQSETAEALLSSIALATDVPMCAVAINGHNTAPADIAVWDITNWKELIRYKASSCPIIQIRLHPSGRWLMTSDSAGNVLLWDLREIHPAAQ